MVGSYGRVFDVIAMGRPEPKAIGLHVRALESGLFESGRPVLLAPPVPLRQLGTNVLIAWNCSTEQARTTALAMPLLQRAEQVTVLYVKGGDEVPGPPASDIVALPAAQRRAGDADDGRRRRPHTPAKRCSRRRSRSIATCWSRAPTPRAGCGR